MLAQPWLLLALTIYFVNLAIAFFIQRPNLRRLVGVRAAADDKTWLERARAAALRVVPDGRAGRHDRVPDELQAGPVVTPGPAAGPTPTDCLFCRIVAGEIPADRLHDDDLVVAIRDIAPRAPTHILLMPAPSHRLGGGADRRRRRRCSAGCSRSPPTSPGRKASPMAGYRLVSNVGRWGGQTVDHLHVHLMGGRRLRLAARVRRPSGFGAIRSSLACRSRSCSPRRGCATSDDPVGGPAAGLGRTRHDRRRRRSA